MADSGTTRVRARILIAEGAELVRRGISDVFAADRRFTVAGEIVRPEELREACLQLSPDIVLFGLPSERDDDAGTLSALAALRRTLHACPLVSIIVLVTTDRMEGLLEAVRAGVRGVLLRDATAQALLEAVDDVLTGSAALDPRLARSLFDYLAAGADASAAPTNLALHPAVLRLLSPREGEVLRLLAHGDRNKEIAAHLGVSVGTVKTHLRHIFRKLMVNDRTAAVLTALQVRSAEAA